MGLDTTDRRYVSSAQTRLTRKKIAEGCSSLDQFYKCRQHTHGHEA